MKRILAITLVILMLTLCGCSTVILGNGTLDLDANDVDHIKITNGLTGNSFSIAEREYISTVIKHMNSYTLEDGEDSAPGVHYSIRLVSTNGGAESYYAVTDTMFIMDRTQFPADVQDLVKYLEKLECKTLTDNELIDALLEGNTLDELNIMDEDGKISVDKILALPNTCPTLFELMSRPSAIASVGTYGVEKIESYLNSNNPALVEKAQEWIQVIQNLMPDVQEKLENLIKNQKNYENNP